MELMSDGKYIVFKVEEFEKMLVGLAEITQLEQIEEHINKYAISDGTTIRAQDIFAAAPLYAYAQAILVAIMVMKENQDKDEDLIIRLENLAEFFLGRAEEAQKCEFKKLPD